jgi:bla regulator protein blaR1
MITYLLKVTLCSGCLLLFYRLVLEREKMFRFNRYYLLGSLVLSVAIPLVPMEIFIGHALFSPPPHMSLGDQAIPGLFSVPLVPEPNLPQSFQGAYLLSIVYLAIGGTLLFRFCKNILRLVKRLQGCEVRELEQIRVVLVDSPTLPHSFLKYVFLPKANYLQGILEPEILDHEYAHVRQWHSLDILFVEFLKVLFWFNPFFYSYRNAIALNHEFLADEEVLRTYRDVPAYQQLLLQKATSAFNQPFTSQFNYSFTKKRFVMMNKQTSKARALLTKGTVLPLFALIFFVFSDLTLAQIAPPPPPVEMPASADVVKEYNVLIDKYINKTKHDFIQEPSKVDGDKMEALLAAMNQEQKTSLDYTIHKIKPLFRTTPTEEEYEKYKNPKEYGVWIDEKKVPNSTLDKYKATDFSQVFVSKLYPNAQKTIGYKYKYQLDLMTNGHYENYRRETLKNQKKYIVLKKNRF